MSDVNAHETLELESVPLNTVFFERLLRSHRSPKSPAAADDWLVEHALAWPSAGVKSRRAEIAATRTRLEGFEPTAGNDDRRPESSFGSGPLPYASAV